MNLQVQVLELQGLLHESVRTIYRLHKRVARLEEIAKGKGSAIDPIVIEDDEEEQEKGEEGKGKGKAREE